jgi:hypothetical protein
MDKQERADSFAVLGVVVYVVAWWWLRAAFMAGLGGRWNFIWVPPCSV